MDDTSDRMLKSENSGTPPCNNTSTKSHSQCVRHLHDAEPQLMLSMHKSGGIHTGRGLHAASGRSAQESSEVVEHAAVTEEIRYRRTCHAYWCSNAPGQKTRLRSTQCSRVKHQAKSRAAVMSPMAANSRMHTGQYRPIPGPPS